MYRRDYIQRLLEELARAVHKSLGLRKEGRLDEALEQIREAYPSYFRIDAERIALVEPDGLLMVFSGEFSLKNEQIEALAMVLHAEGEVLAARNEITEARDRFQKALLLYEYLEENDRSTFSIQRKNNMAGIRDFLAEGNNDPAEQLPL